MQTELTDGNGRVGYDELRQSADFIAKQAGTPPDTALVLGSGLGGFGTRVCDAVRLPYTQIPFFPRSTVASHAGLLLCGRIAGRPCFVLSGRFHYYEGWSFEEAARYVRVFKLLGVKNLLLTNAAGSVNEGFAPGSLMLVRDHINFSGQSPCRGPNDERFGERFFDMTSAYSPTLRRAARNAAQASGIPLCEGVYAYMTGPQYETPAEVRALRLLGADAVGMSTVPEAIEAAHCGMNTLCISVLTNYAAGITGSPLSDSEVVAAADRASGALARLMEGLAAAV